MTYRKRNPIADLANEMSLLHDGTAVAEWIAEHIPTHRVRRGRVVEIPAEWRGDVTRPQTIRNRPSKLTRKERMRRDNGGTWGKKNGHPRTWAPRHTPGAIRAALGEDR